MADEPSAMREEEEDNAESIRPEFPKSRIKKIMKLDTDINLVNSEALLLVACAAQLFLEFLAERSAEVTAEKKRKIVKLEHMRVAVKRHRPTSDFLLDELPVPFQPSDHQEIDRSRAGTVAQSSAPAGRDRSRSRKAADKPAPAGSRRIDAFFGNLAKQAAIQTEEAPIGTGEARNATEEALIETDDAPIGTGEARNATEEALIETDDAPVGTGEARNATEEALIETDAPSESGEARDETDEGPMESKAASTEIEEAPIESDVASTEAEGSPIETDEIPMEINEISNEVDES